MRQIFTCCSLLFSLFAFSQPTLKSDPDLLKGLQGKLASVAIVKAVSKNDSVSKDSTPITFHCGAGRSNTLETEPLIVIDGVPYDNTSTSSGNKYGSVLANLDPNDIESF